MPSNSATRKTHHVNDLAAAVVAEESGALSLSSRSSCVMLGESRCFYVTCCSRYLNSELARGGGSVPALEPRCCPAVKSFLIVI